MIITVANTTLRFYEIDGWTEEKVRTLLVNSNMKITFRKFSCKCSPNYFAVYSLKPNKTDHKIFKKSEIDKHTFVDTQNFSETDWYINENE